MKVLINRIIPEAGLQLLREAGIEITQWKKLIANCEKVNALLNKTI